MFLGFNNFYASNSTVASRGETLVPGFHPRVSAVAFKLAHNWGVKLFGGALVSSLAVPVVDIHFGAPFGTQHKIGVSNPAPETLVAYKIGSLHWWYGVEVFTPGFSSKKTDLVNIGQHNYAAAPSAAFSYLPNHGTTERSSKFQYIVNYRNDATQYRSGDELVWEYAAMRNVSRALAIGGNGDFYPQTANDLRNGSIYLDGDRHFESYSMIVKCQRDFLTENRIVTTRFGCTPVCLSPCNVSRLWQIGRRVQCTSRTV